MDPQDAILGQKLSQLCIIFTQFWQLKKVKPDNSVEGGNAF